VFVPYNAGTSAIDGGRLQKRKLSGGWRLVTPDWSQAMNDDVRERMSSGETWLRLLFIAMFGFFATVATWLIWLVAAAQFLFSLFTGRANDNLSGFADTLVAYVAQAFSYMVYRTDEKPFPFAPPPKKVVVDGVARAAAKSAADQGRSNKVKAGEHEPAKSATD
jgi:hypothetical protein